MGGVIKLGNPDGKYGKWLDWFCPEIRDEYDSLPRWYEDETVFVIGGGPSINHTDLSSIKKRPVVGCNDAFKLGTWVDWCVFADKRWFHWNENELERWPNRERLICLVPQLLEERNVKWPWLKILRRDEARFGLSVEQDTICWNRGCGGAAINAAYLLGAARIVLLGFDMRMVDGKHNWHDNHQKAERDKIYQNSMMPFLKPMSDAMKVTGIQIANATPGSALNLFTTVPLEELLKKGW
jgi:hypothetical protein